MSHTEYVFTYTHPPGTHTVAVLARWVRGKTMDQLTLPDALCIARSLLRGESWRPLTVSNFAPGPCHMETEYVKDPYTLNYERRAVEYADGVELALRGAAGDADAAIEFCKLFGAGVMENRCMG